MEPGAELAEILKLFFGLYAAGCAVLVVLYFQGK